MRVLNSRVHRRLVFSLALVVLAVSVKSSFASDETAHQPVGIVWQQGPLTASLGGVAEIEVPRGFKFTDAAGTRRFLELNQNPTSGQEVGLIMPIRTSNASNEDWFMLFEFHEIGYVSDEEKGKLDSSVLLGSIKKGTESANEIRKQKGWPAFHVTGWSKEPFYDDQTHNLTWAILGQDDSPQGSPTVNYSVRLLGRRGTMSVDLVLAPDQLPSVLSQFNQLMQHYSYTGGNRYSEFIHGDKVAGYGLTALIAGGAAAAAVKTGLFSKLFRLLAAAAIALWKFILILVAALASLFKKLANRIKNAFGSKTTDDATIEPERQMLPESTQSTDHDQY
jgi:uncharacterized membrane-anchored protein